MRPPWEQKTRKKLELSEEAWHTVEFLASKQKVTPSLLLDKVILGLSPGDFAEAFRRGVDKETAARMAWNAGGKR